MLAASTEPLAGVPRPGDILDGKCRIDGVLGVGGMGVVLAATHLHLERRVAVKLLLPEHAQDHELVARFLQEGRAAARLKSEHVARVYDVATKREGGEPYMIMEYLDGEDLGHVLKSRHSLGTIEAVDYLLQACEAVAEAHSKGIIHRDLKPSNLFLARQEDGSTCVKVLDFGISKLLSDPAADAAPQMNITKTRSILGSPSYMSPEQLRASKNVDARADIWALGVILYELLSGSPPFDGQTIAELGAQVLVGAVPPLCSRGHVPEGVEAVITRCLQKDREHRFESVAGLADALARFGSERALALAGRIRISSARSGPGSDPSLASSLRPSISSPALTPGSDPAIRSGESDATLPQLEAGVTPTSEPRFDASTGSRDAATAPRVAVDATARRGRGQTLAAAVVVVVGLFVGGAALVRWGLASTTSPRPQPASTVATMPAPPDSRGASSSSAAPVAAAAPDVPPVLEPAEPPSAAVATPKPPIMKAPAPARSAKITTPPPTGKSADPSPSAGTPPAKPPSERFQ